MTPLQCVVLNAYARLLPSKHPSRQLIEQEAQRRNLPPQVERVATGLAECSGLMERGRLTEFGRMAAKTYLKRIEARGTA